MRKLAPVLYGCLVACALGCGPVTSPLPPRLDDESQKSIDDSWNQALTPVVRYDHQALLDLLLCTNAYEIGVDRLTFHSEKKIAVGLVVMDIYFERAAPEKDRFDVKVLDVEGKVLRQESYDRKEIEKTYQELGQEREALRCKKAQGSATPQEIRKLEDLEARWAIVQRVFPKLDKPAEKKDGTRTQVKVAHQ